MSAASRRKQQRKSYAENSQFMVWSKMYHYIIKSKFAFSYISLKQKQQFYNENQTFFLQNEVEIRICHV